MQGRGVAPSNKKVFEADEFLKIVGPRVVWFLSVPVVDKTTQQDVTLYGPRALQLLQQWVIEKHALPGEDCGTSLEYIVKLETFKHLLSERFMTQVRQLKGRIQENIAAAGAAASDAGPAFPGTYVCAKPNGKRLKLSGKQPVVTVAANNPGDGW